MRTLIVASFHCYTTRRVVVSLKPGWFDRPSGRWAGFQTVTIWNTTSRDSVLYHIHTDTLTVAFFFVIRVSAILPPSKGPSI